MTKLPTDTDPLTELWYEDGIKALRCKVCQALQTDGHRADCPIGKALALVMAILESPALMGCDDIERLGEIHELLSGFVAEFD